MNQGTVITSDKMDGILLVLGIILASVTSTKANYTLTEEEAVDICIKEHDVPGNELEQIFKVGEVPDTEPSKCFLACFMTNVGFIGEDGTIIWDKINEANKMEYADPADQTKAIEVSALCMEKVSQDLGNICETAFSAMKCFVEEAKQQGLPLSEPDVQVVQVDSE